VGSDRKSKVERARKCRRRNGTENVRRKVLNNVGGVEGQET